MCSGSIFGTHPESKILFTDVNILDSTGRDPYRGDVLMEGEKITKVGAVPNAEELKKDSKVRVFYGRGRTLLSGLGDAHTHFTWNGGDLGSWESFKSKSMCRLRLEVRSATLILDTQCKYQNTPAKPLPIP